MEQPVEFKKTRDLGEIINDTFNFLKQQFKPLLSMFIYFSGVFILGGMVLAIFQQVWLQRAFSMRDFNFLRTGLTAFSGQYFLTSVFSLAAYTAMNVSVLSYIALYVSKGNIAPTREEVWNYFKYYFFRAFGGSLLMGLFLIASFCFCLFPGFYVFPAVSLFLPVMIMENGNISYAFKKAFRLLKGQWWPTAGVIFLLWMITYACMSLVSLPSVLFGFTSLFTPNFSGLGSGTVVLMTALQYACQVFMLLPLTGLALCYYNLEERKENTGLMERIGRLGEKTDEQWPPETF